MTTENRMPPKGAHVFVAMSGGIDSTATAALLCEHGYRVSGITMHFDAANSHAGGNDTIAQAAAVARALGIPHYVIDMSASLEEDVIAPFVSEYCAGRTPNPCVRCNEHVKFGRLLDDVRRRGGDMLATGHYARLRENRQTHTIELLKGSDSKKDQSYFLYRLSQDALRAVVFPLGAMTKDAVRAYIIEKKIPFDRDRKESQDICFIPTDGYATFLQRRTQGSCDNPGDFIDDTGMVVGQHKGIAYYTIGQRDKLGIALGHPVYVSRIDAVTNTVTVSNKERLLATGLYASDVHYVAGMLPEETVEVMARIRYNASDVKAVARMVSACEMEVTFTQPQTAVTPGQSVVLFDGEKVLGGGIITEARK